MKSDAVQELKPGYTVADIRKLAAPVAEKHGVKSLSLFGSYARGDADGESDVDFLIENGAITSLFKYYAFVLDLEDALGRHVDVITEGIEDKEFWNSIKKDEVLLYEA